MRTAHVLRYASIGLATLGLGLGVAAADGSINTTGPDSSNHISSTTSQSAYLSNHNNAGVANLNGQAGKSGSAKTADNTTAGGAMSGDVANSNSSNTNVAITNGSGAGAGFFTDPSTGSGGSITLTGPDSNNSVTNKTTQTFVENNSNNVEVLNANVQLGSSGSAGVYHNTTAGDATSGSVMNTSSSSTSVSINN